MISNQPYKSEFALLKDISIKEWISQGKDDYDGLFMHDALYPGHLTHRIGATINEPIEVFKGLIRAEIDRLVASAKTGDSLRIVDYGCGTGLAIIETLNLLEQTDLGKEILAKDLSLEFYALDLPSPWFSTGQKLLKDSGCVRFFSLFDKEARKFLLIDEVLPAKSVDLVLSSMVFHLIPEKALPRMFAAMADVLKSSGALVWNSPDLVEDSSLGFKMHTPYRILREQVTRLLTDKAALDSFFSSDLKTPQHICSYVKRHLSEYAAFFDPASLDELNRVADAYIKPDERVPEPEKMHRYLSECFEGNFTSGYFSIQEEHIYPPILVPSNENYINQIPPGLLRNWLVQLLLHDYVVPKLLQEYGEDGLKIGWIFGSYRNT